MRTSVKEHIIATASELFYTKGYNRTGINEIIKEAGIAKATLYNHFASKEDICLAYLDFKHASFMKKIKDFITEEFQGEHSVFGLFYFLEKFFEQNDFNGCWCLNTIAEIPKDNQKVIAKIQDQKKEFLNFIEKLIRGNQTPKQGADAASLSKQIYLLYESAISESKLHQNPWPITTALVVCKKLIT